MQVFWERARMVGHLIGSSFQPHCLHGFPYLVWATVWGLPFLWAAPRPGCTLQFVAFVKQHPRQDHVWTWRLFVTYHQLSQGRPLREQGPPGPLRWAHWLLRVSVMGLGARFVGVPGRCREQCWGCPGLLGSCPGAEAGLGRPLDSNTPRVPAPLLCVQPAGSPQMPLCVTSGALPKLWGEGNHPCEVPGMGNFSPSVLSFALWHRGPGLLWVCVSPCQRARFCGTCPFPVAVLFSMCWITRLPSWLL